MKDHLRTIGFILMAIAFYGGLGLMDAVNSNTGMFCGGIGQRLIPGC